MLRLKGPFPHFPTHVHTYSSRWFHHLYNSAQLSTSSFLSGTLGYFCLLVWNGSNDVTDPGPEPGTWSHLLLKGQRGSYASGCINHGRKDACLEPDDQT